MLEGLYGMVPDISILLRNLSYLLWAALALLLSLFLMPDRHFSSIGLFLKMMYRKAERNRKKIGGLAAAVVLILVAVHMAAFQVDAETKAIPAGKLVIIEIDDFWSLEGGHFDGHGYSIENYESIISTIEGHGYDASLGVVPYIFIEETQEMLPLREDVSMVAYLRSKKASGHEIAMHGYAHCRNWLYCPAYEENYLNILQGRREIDTLFNQSTIIYLPPANLWIDPQYENVKRAGFLVTANTRVQQPYWDKDVLITQRGYDVVERWDWYGGDYEHSPYGDWIDGYGEADVFILQLHCNTFDSEEKLDDLDRFLGFLESENATVVTYEEAYASLYKGRE